MKVIKLNQVKPEEPVFIAPRYVIAVRKGSYQTWIDGSDEQIPCTEVITSGIVALPNTRSLFLFVKETPEEVASLIENTKETP